jgi:hypothetical protein
MQRDTWLRLVFRMVLPFFMNDHLIWYAHEDIARMEVHAANKRLSFCAATTRVRSRTGWRRTGWRPRRN